MNNSTDLYPEHQDTQPRRKIDEDGFLLFGEHEGEHIRSIPASYLEWIRDEFDSGLDENTDLIEAIEEQLAKRYFTDAGSYDDSVY